MPVRASSDPPAPDRETPEEFSVSALPPPDTWVEVAPVTRGAFERTIDEDGKTRVRERYVVSAPLAGRVQKRLVSAGDFVKRGSPLFEIATSGSLRALLPWS